MKTTRLTLRRRQAIYPMCTVCRWQTWSWSVAHLCLCELQCPEAHHVVQSGCCEGMVCWHLQTTPMEMLRLFVPILPEVSHKANSRHHNGLVQGWGVLLHWMSIPSLQRLWEGSSSQEFQTASTIPGISVRRVPNCQTEMYRMQHV